MPPASAPAPGRRRLLHYLLVFAIVVLIVDGLAGDNGLLEQMRAGKEYQAQARALAALRAENEGLRSDIQRLREDPAAMELLAREELGLIKPGEVLFIVRDTKPARF